MIELTCPYCESDHDVEIPKDCEYGGVFTASCGKVVECIYMEGGGEQVWGLLPSREDHLSRSP